MTSPMITTILERLAREEIRLDWYSGKTILVTGGAGFIGSWLVESLVRLGSDVFVVDNLWRGTLDNLIRDGYNTWIPLSSRFLEGDLREYQIALTAMIWAKPDLVFHLADIVAGVDYVFSNEPFLFRANSVLNSNVYAALRETSVPNLIYLGTACSYPRVLQEKTERTPLVEEQAYPAEPESAYGWSKLMGEYEAELLAKYHTTNLGILRLHNVYGPRAMLDSDRSQVIPSLIRKAIRYPEEEFVVWGSGMQARDFVFVGDVIDALIRMPIRGMGQGVIQIGTAVETTVADLAKLVVEVSGKKIPIRFDTSKPEGDFGRSGDHGKASRILGWRVNTTLLDGIQQTYRWAEDRIRRDRARRGN